MAIDAVIPCDVSHNEPVFMFIKGGEVHRTDWSVGATKTLGEMWRILPNQFRSGVDAAARFLPDPPTDGTEYRFIKGDQVVTMKGGFPRKVANLWETWPDLPNEFTVGVDAACFSWILTDWTFFKGDKIYDRLGYMTLEKRFPGWLPSSFNEGIDAACLIGDGWHMLFKGDEYFYDGLTEKITHRFPTLPSGWT
ncbi:hypothetical protein [Nonomuraea aurantiaca]|jgi:hypothetical protein|uniref:hypothetical protein n=1 Tax=Nonomuraea aurantiaca TaxID=2878562 RepID=UPI001CDA1F45|nr:hypothetical protein [Nonomuraea aurantiaca]MCA2229319.1 hypothetical protein [Nonomuraea aurantiaca]